MSKEKVLVKFEDWKSLEKEDLVKIISLNFLGEIGQKLLVTANINNRFLEELERLSKNVSLKFHKNVFEKASLIYCILKQFIAYEKAEPTSTDRYATIIALMTLLVDYAQDYGNYLINFSIEEMQKLGAVAVEKHDS